jgi:membrane protein YdbS with pleckstrin-like domain
VLKALVLRLAKMPAEPHIPEGTQGSVMVFHPGRNYFKLRIFLWALGNLLVAIPLWILLAVALFARMPAWLHTFWLVVAWFAIVLFVVSLPLTFFMQRLNYEMRWYIVTDRSLRLRRGVIWVNELTMTFANIQEIRVKVNPLQRLLGLANVEVHAAGGNTVSTSHGTFTVGHVGKFESVDNASEIRDLMMERLRVYRDSGLGLHAQTEASASSHAELDAAHAVLREVKALRTVIAT